MKLVFFLLVDPFKLEIESLPGLLGCESEPCSETECEDDEWRWRRPNVGKVDRFSLSGVVVALADGAAGGEGGVC